MVLYLINTNGHDYYERTVMGMLDDRIWARKLKAERQAEQA
jgi:hypothetical protein